MRAKRPKGKVVNFVRVCILVEMGGGNEILESLASHAKEFGPFSKENVNSKGYYARRKKKKTEEPIERLGQQFRRRDRTVSEIDRQT